MSDFTYLDTNVVIDLYNMSTSNSPLNQSSVTRNQDIKRFITQLQTQDKLILYSQHNLDEFYAILTQKLQRQYVTQNQLTDVKDIPKSSNIRINDEAYGEIVDFEQNVLGQFSEKLSYTSWDVDSKKYEISRQTGLCLPDAKHIAIADQHDVKSIFTNDGDFVATEGLNIYGSTARIHSNFMSNKPTDLHR